MSLNEVMQGQAKSMAPTLNTNISPAYVSAVQQVRNAPSGAVISKVRTPTLTVATPRVSVESLLSVGGGWLTPRKDLVESVLNLTPLAVKDSLDYDIRRDTPAVNLGDYVSTAIDTYSALPGADPDVVKYWDSAPVTIPDIGIPDIFGGLKNIAIIAIVALGAIMLLKK